MPLESQCRGSSPSPHKQQSHSPLERRVVAARSPYFFAVHRMLLPSLKMQDVSFTDPASRYLFRPGADKPFVATPAAIKHYSDVLRPCLRQLQSLAEEHDGIDYLLEPT